MEACAEEFPVAHGPSMEKATKWDGVHANHYLDGIFLGSHHPTTIWKLPHSVRHLPRSSNSTVLTLLEAELEKARAQIGELEDEKRVTRKRLERFLRKLAEENAAWKTRVREKAQLAVAALKEEVRLERKRRRQLEAANAKLMHELTDARLSAKQQAQSYEMERKAWELMEEACSELTREVEENQAEVELLRRECLRMREEMEEERRMLQMAEVWREERVQMKLSDAKLALETKYSQLNRLQAEMESSLRNKDSKDSSALREARMISEAAAASSSLKARRDHYLHANNNENQVDVDSVFQHSRWKEEESGAHSKGARYSPASPASSSNVEDVSPATDLFLAKVDDDDPYSDGSADDGGRDSNSIPNSGSRGLDGRGVTESHSSGATRRSGSNNTALIRRLWSSAITESRKKSGGAEANGGGWSPSPDRG